MLRKIFFLLATIVIFGCSVQQSNVKEEEETMENTKVLFTTNIGEFEVELFDNEAPETVKNFISYVNSGFYKGTIFHRVIPDFMAQGGGYKEDFEQKEGDNPIKNEAANKLKNERGTLAMARTNDPHSATSQFFINFVDNSFLDFVAENPHEWGYAVFGKVTTGMDVVDKMGKIPTGRYQYFSDVPKETIIIEDVKVVEQ